MFVIIVSFFSYVYIAQVKVA